MPDDVTRRTLLAAERTWLAWWRTGIAAAAASVAVGGVIPQLVDGSRGPYIALGAAYAVLSAAVFAASGLRQTRMQRALDEHGYEPLDSRWVAGLTAAGALLALATLAIIVIQP